MKGLLIGVAGFHREHFSASHVVHTVQAASKHFEHHPEFLTMAHALLVEKRMDGHWIGNSAQKCEISWLRPALPRVKLQRQPKEPRLSGARLGWTNPHMPDLRDAE